MIGSGGMSPAAALQALAELKLLRLMQEEVNLRTRQLEDTLGATQDPKEDVRREYVQLSQEQGQLADLLYNLMPARGDPEDRPDGLPGDGDEMKESVP